MKGRALLHMSVPLIHPTLEIKIKKKRKKKRKTLHNLEVATSSEHNIAVSFKTHELV